MQNYTLFDEYITLGQFLKELGLIATGGQAKLYLAENDGQIYYNGEPENRRGKKLFAGDLLEIRSENLSVKFDKASSEEIAAHEADKIEENRVKALVKAMNKNVKPVKSDKPSKPKSPFHK